jgi:hypothetical protein
MAQLNTQGNYMMALLEKIKSYEKYSHHKPKIATGIDTFIDYVDYFFLPIGEKKASVLVLLTLMPMPGEVFYHDYILVFINPNTITSILYDDYYNFTSLDVGEFDNADFDISSFYKTMLQITSYGCLNWGIPFRQFALRSGSSMYMAAIKSVNPTNNMFTILCDTLVPDAIRPISKGNIASSYETIELLFIPLMHLTKIGSPLGIYPENLLNHFNILLKERFLNKKPLDWMNASERKRRFINPYRFGQTVFSQRTLKSYISLIDDNIYNPDDEFSITKHLWKEIDYKKMASDELIPEEIPNPIENLLSQFNHSFDTSLLYP